MVSLTRPMDLTSPLCFGNAAQSRYRQPTSSGWIRDVLDCPFTIGDDTHDLMELFLPGLVVSAENQGTFSDYHDVEFTPGIFLTGGLWSMILASGIMVDDIWELNGIFYSVSSRLLKLP